MTQSPQAGAPAANQFGVFQVKYPSPAQVKFIKTLVSKKVNPVGDEFTGMLASLNDGTLNKKASSRMIEMLLAVPSKPDARATINSNPATQKQFDFLKSLIESKEMNPAAESAVKMGREAAMAGTFTSKQASALIEVLKGLPRKQSPSFQPEVEMESGMYRTDAGTIYKVYKAVHGSGKMCAKELVLHEPDCGGCANGEYCNPEPCKWTAEFVYRGLASRFVKAEQRMSLEQAKEFGAIYGVCCKCGATLTDEESIAEGIGPVCSKKGWA